MRRVIRTTLTAAALLAVREHAWPQTQASSSTQQPNDATPSKAALDCTAQPVPAPEPASKTKQTLSWTQRQAAKLAALTAGQIKFPGSSGGTQAGQVPPPQAPASTPCPAPDPTAPATTQPVAAPVAKDATATSDRSLFSGTANNHKFGRGQAGMGTAGGGYVEWDHEGRAANSEIPNVFVREPGKAPAQAAYLGHEESLPNVHYLRSTAESVTYKLVFSGNNFALFRLSMADEMALGKLKLVGGTEQAQDDHSDGAAGVEAGSPIEISNGDGTQAVLTYTDSSGRSGTLNVHRMKANSNPDGQWLNPDETVLFTVAGSKVTLSPAKSH